MWVASRRSTVQVKWIKKRVENRTKRYTSIWEAVWGRGPKRGRRNKGQRRPQRKSILKSQCTRVSNTRERSRKIKTEKRPVAFVMKRSLLFHLCQWSFSEVVEEASRLQWCKEWIRAEETETVNTDNLFQEPGCKTRESTMVGGRVGVSMERSMPDGLFHLLL